MINSNGEYWILNFSRKLMDYECEHAKGLSQHKIRKFQRQIN